MYNLTQAPKKEVHFRGRSTNDLPPPKAYYQLVKYTAKYTLAKINRNHYCLHIGNYGWSLVGAKLEVLKRVYWILRDCGMAEDAEAIAVLIDSERNK